jgi:uncharacterized protein HemX
MDQFRAKPQQQKAVQQPRPVAPQHNEEKSPKTGHKKLFVVAIVIVIAVVTAGLGWKFICKNKNLTGVDTTRYQALFLTNGQVYFGKLSKADGKTIKIDDIFYLQVQQAVQPKTDTETQGETQLIKLGGELHGPEDSMFIDRGQVLFWENLKDDGKVVQAIKQYKK